MFHQKKIQILFTFRKTYKINTIITEMYFNIFPDITVMCYSRYSYNWACFGNFGISSRRSFLVWVTEEKFVVERKMTIRYSSSASLVTSTHFDFYFNLEVHVMHFIQNHSLQIKTVKRHTSY